MITKKQEIIVRLRALIVQFVALLNKKSYSPRQFLRIFVLLMWLKSWRVKAFHFIIGGRNSYSQQWLAVCVSHSSIVAGWTNGFRIVILNCMMVSSCQVWVVVPFGKRVLSFVPLSRCSLPTNSIAQMSSRLYDTGFGGSYAYNYITLGIRPGRLFWNLLFIRKSRRDGVGVSL